MSQRERRCRVLRSVIIAIGWLAVCASAAQPAVADDKPSFYRAINLNGPALVIDDHPWEAGDAPGVSIDGLAGFENQAVRLTPATDNARAQMIRSSRWSSSGKAQIQVSGLPAGTYSVFLYVWEDNDSQTFDVHLAGREVVHSHRSGQSGRWDRLGPWVVDVAEGRLELTATGGHANLSGLEIWRGKLGPADHPLPELPASAAPQSPEAEVALVLARNCLECHNPSQREGGLDLTRRAKALAGGESGEVLQPGEPDRSLLVKHIESGEMPPKEREPLGLEDRQRIRQWVKAGAKWAADPIDPFLYTSDRRAGYNWWSLQPLRAVEPPEVSWSPADGPNSPNQAGVDEHPIDRFLGSRLQQAGLRPSPEADRRTLIRRLTFDLIGLPPTPEEVEQFVNDPDPRAYEQLVDRLLDSPHYGERWARHWLDIVRFGESQGFERNKLRPNAWKYRDFVVEAFNADMPYDQFIRWQIAGDVLAPDDPLAVVASGFLAIGPYDLTAYTTGTPDMRALAREEELEGLVGSVGQTFLGLTINCSRCHDHKFDPITHREYYQVSAALGGTYQGEEREVLTPAGKTAVESRVAALEAQISASPEAAAAGNGDRPSRATQRSRLESMVRLLQGGPVHTTVPQQPGAWQVLARGDFKQPGEVVAPGGIAAVRGVSADWKLGADAPEATRRQALAAWIANANNPLTSRVIVNRLWGYHFGTGLVHTPSDFGFQGGLPSHPELLDWLAWQLVHPAEGPAWSLKRMQRLMVTSRAYRQTARATPEALAADPDNRLLGRRSAQRLEAEAFRDAALAVSGELDPRLGGPGFRDFTVVSAGSNENYTVFDAVGSEFNRRSLYRTWLRGGTNPLLDTLDCPDPSVPTPRRSVTSTPLQALTLLNDAFIDHYAARFAARLARDAGDDLGAQIRRAYALAYARQPTEGELEYCRQFIAKHGVAQFCVVVFNTSEFLFID